MKLAQGYALICYDLIKKYIFITLYWYPKTEKATI